MRAGGKLRRTMMVATAGLLAMCLTLTGAACARPTADTGKVVVAVTLLPQAGFLDAIGGDRVEVVVMVPPGASPHTYEVTPDQMVLLSRASMYAKVGSPVEFELSWLDKLLAANREMLVVDCARGITLIDADGEHHHDEVEHHEEEEADHEDEDDHHHRGADPHIWLSVPNAKVMVSNICDGLVQVDPDGESFYRANCAAFIEELSSLDQELRGAFSGLENRRFIVFHPAFGYFARDYELVQIAVEKGGNEPDAAYMIRLIEEAKQHGIQVVFVAPQFSTQSAEAIAREMDGRVVRIDPLARDYVTNLRHVASAIANAT
jgi:zinc transport system substrate-binding protein